MDDFINIPQHHVHLNSGVQYLTYAGAEIAFDYQCASETPTHLFILVNGYQRNRLDFRIFRKKLEKYVPHVATVALDNRYCGETKLINASRSGNAVSGSAEQFQDFSMEIMARDVNILSMIFMQKLNLKSFSLLGISMGGMIVQTLASLLPPSSLDILCLVSTTCGGIGRTWPRPVADPKLLKYENKNIDLESTKKNMLRYFADRFLKSSPLLFEMMCKNMVKNSAGDEINVAAAEQYRVSAQFDGVEQLKKISANKTVIFSGDEDKIIPVENAYYLHEHIVNSQLIIYPQVGHLLLIEEPERFVQDVASLFR